MLQIRGGLGIKSWFDLSMFLFTITGVTRIFAIGLLCLCTEGLQD